MSWNSQKLTTDKQVYNCDYTYAYDLKKGSFKDFFNSKPFRDYVIKSESCNKCVRTCVRGYSYTYNMYPRQIRGLAGEARNLFNRPVSDYAYQSPGAVSDAEAMRQNAGVH